MLVGSTEVPIRTGINGGCYCRGDHIAGDRHLPDRATRYGICCQGRVRLVSVDHEIVAFAGLRTFITRGKPGENPATHHLAFDLDTCDVMAGVQHPIDHVAGREAAYRSTGPGLSTIATLGHERPQVTLRCNDSVEVTRHLQLPDAVSGTHACFVVAKIIADDSSAKLAAIDVKHAAKRTSSQRDQVTVGHGDFTVKVFTHLECSQSTFHCHVPGHASADVNSSNVAHDRSDISARRSGDLDSPGGIDTQRSAGKLTYGHLVDRSGIEVDIGQIANLQSGHTTKQVPRSAVGIACSQPLHLTVNVDISKLNARACGQGAQSIVVVSDNVDCLDCQACVGNIQPGPVCGSHQDDSVCAFVVPSATRAAKVECQVANGYGTGVRVELNANAGNRCKVHNLLCDAFKLRVDDRIGNDKALGWIGAKTVFYCHSNY